MSEAEADTIGQEATPTTQSESETPSRGPTPTTTPAQIPIPIKRRKRTSQTESVLKRMKVSEERDDLRQRELIDATKNMMQDCTKTMLSGIGDLLKAIISPPATVSRADGSSSSTVVATPHSQYSNPPPFSQPPSLTPLPINTQIPSHPSPFPHTPSSTQQLPFSQPPINQSAPYTLQPPFTQPK